MNGDDGQGRHVATSRGRSSLGANPTDAVGELQHRRLRMLDGWRALSILLVLATHLLPLGPRRWSINAEVGIVGMAVFFTLSGFLIVSILRRDPDIGRFLVRRIARIVPLAWLALMLTLPLEKAGSNIWVANLLFYANLPPFPLAPWSGHFWSLGVEMQFYIAIAIVILGLGRRGLWLVPAAAAAVTASRIAVSAEVSIVTWLRVDEILAGGILALIIHAPGGRWSRGLARLPFWPVAILAALSATPSLPWLNYARPYLIAATVGVTILRRIPILSPLLESRPAAYVARISYALYIIHPFMVHGWLESGVGWIRYSKRPLVFALTFGLAHLSTFHFESRFITWSHCFRRRLSLPVPI